MHKQIKKKNNIKSTRALKGNSMNTKDYFDSLFKSFETKIIYTSSIKTDHAFDNGFMDELIFSDVSPDQFIRNIGSRAVFRSRDMLVAMIQINIFQRLGDPVFYSRLRDYIENSAEKSINSTIFHCNGIKDISPTNIMRDEKNDLVSRKFLTKIQSKSNLVDMIRNIVYHDDVDAYKELESIGFYAGYMKNKEIESILDNIDLVAGSKVLNHILEIKRPNEKPNIIRYINVLRSISLMDHDKAMAIYRPDMITDFGYAITRNIIERAADTQNSAFLEMITDSVKNGSDWYASLIQIYAGESTYIETLDREKDTIEDIMHAIHIWNDVPKLKKSRAILGAIINGLPESVRKELLEDPAVNKVVKRVSTMAATKIEAGRKGPVAEVNNGPGL